MSGSQRAKGKRGESEAREFLRNRGYKVIPLRCGEKSEDILATLDGVTYAVEVKNCAIWNWARFRAQAMDNAEARGARWVLMMRVPFYKAFVVLFQGDKRVHVWNQEETA